MAPVERAFLLPAPGGPSVSTVIEQRYANATEQEILLGTSARTPGQNAFRVQLFGPAERGAGQSALRDGFLPVTTWASDMRSALPGIAMQKSPYYVQNQYGAFGYAVGRSSQGDTCLYAWQAISSVNRVQTFVGNKGSIQIRLRYCDATAGEQQLLKAMYGFTVRAHFDNSGWNPYGAPKAADPAIGQNSSPIYPLGASEFATVLPDAPAPQRPRRPRPAPEPIVEQPEPIGPAVPLPPGSGASSSPSTRPAPAEDPATLEPTGAAVPPPPNRASRTIRIPPPEAGAN